jgi:hypothetical protein
MKGDFTRQTFRGRNHYRGVLQQQGRVQLDADWNEQVLLQAHLDRLVAEDTIGAHGAPEHAEGIAIVGPDGKPPAGPLAPKDLRISPGRYHVHGILCENEDFVPLGAQPDLPGVPLPDAGGRYIAFLDVWHEFVTSAERPALREVALGGPDTATRTRTVWQVRVRPENQPPPPQIGSGQLRARAESSGPVTSPCDAPTGTGYRRLDNQLYRVEIRDPGNPGAPGTAGTATFLWSRENGSVTARLIKLQGDDLTLDSIGRDGRLSFDKGWVEVTDSGRVLRGEPGFLGSIGHTQGDTVTVAEWYSGVAPQQHDLGDDAIVRRWESGPLPVTAPATPDDWIGLESGVQVQFRDTGFRTGDYWLIPARTANLEGAPGVPGLAGNVDWPQDAGGPAYQPPEGIWHAYADIAELELAGGQWTVADRRPVFPPLTELADDVEVGYAGGDGQQVLPGNALPQPLEVSVTRRGTGVPGAIVRFEAADADGRLAGSAGGLTGSTVSVADVPADADGVARCWWRPANDIRRPRQRVTARWIDRNGQPADPLIDFSAAFALASGVGFDPAGCARLAGAGSVQAAINTLAATPALVPAGGDGQDGRAGTDLPRPVTVQARTGCGDPVPGAVVRFSVSSGAVAPTAAALAGAGRSVDITADPSGSADCWWRLGDQAPVQALAAGLLAGGAPDLSTEPLTFVAGAVPVDGIHVTGVVLTGPGTALQNDAQVAASDLARGLTVLLDGPPDRAAVTGKPVLTVTLDLPFPLSAAEQALWGDQVVGTMPLTLAGQADVGATGGSPEVTWTAGASSQALLGRLFGVLDTAKAGDRVLCRLALDGRATGGRGYAQWNWLVLSVMRLMLVPHRNGKLSLPSGRQMVARAIPRDAVRAAVRTGVKLSDEPSQDPGQVRRAAGNAFRNGADRRLVLVAAEPYAAAAGVIAAALADAAQVAVEVIPAADPAAEASNRIAAGNPVDGILTDDAGLSAVTALPDFPEAYPL